MFGVDVDADIDVDFDEMEMSRTIVSCRVGTHLAAVGPVMGQGLGLMGLRSMGLKRRRRWRLVRLAKCRRGKIELEFKKGGKGEDGSHAIVRISCVHVDHLCICFHVLVYVHVWYLGAAGSDSASGDIDDGWTLLDPDPCVISLPCEYVLKSRRNVPSYQRRW